MLRLAVVSLARLERVLEGAGRLQWEAGCWGAPMPQGCSGSLGGGLSPHPPPGVALGGTVLPALAHRRSGKCTGTSRGLSVGAASSPTRPSSELRDLTSWGSLFSSSLLGFLCTTTQKFLDLRRCRGTEGHFRRSGLMRIVKPSELCWGALSSGARAQHGMSPFVLSRAEVSRTGTCQSVHSAWNSDWLVAAAQ